MKRFLFLLFIYLSIVGIAFAQESAKYNFGSAQGAKDLFVAPGKEVVAKLYFYNVFGNRTTHIALNVSEAPSNWSIEIVPELTTETYDVSGVPTSVKENLAVEPDQIVQQIPQEGRTGFNFIPAPNVGGFIPAKEAWIKIKAPSNEQLGKTFKLKVSAEASWLGQLGTVAFKQDRVFEYNITTASEEFFERKVSAGEAPVKQHGIVETIVEGINALVVMATSNFLVGIILVLVVVLLALLLLKRKPKAKKKT